MAAFAPPAGDVYYVDFTELAADYGWTRVPALDGWQSHWDAIRAWHFERADGLSWDAAMLEVYPQAEIDEVFR